MDAAPSPTRTPEGQDEATAHEGKAAHQALQWKMVGAAGELAIMHGVMP